MFTRQPGETDAELRARMGSYIMQTRGTKAYQRATDFVDLMMRLLRLHYEERMVGYRSHIFIGGVAIRNVQHVAIIKDIT